MPNKFDPFRPNSLAAPGMFCGRWEEIKTIEQCLRQTKGGNPSHFLIAGERGIGKSSLCLVEALCARGEHFTPLAGPPNFKFIVLQVRLRDQDDMYAIIKRISVALKVQISRYDKIKDYALKAWELISRLEVKGVSLRENTSLEEDELLQRLEDDLASVISGYGDELDGILILIDEADKPGSGAHLGLMCKLITEGMTDRRLERVCVGLSGLPATIDKLRASHESSTRLFTILNLKPLEEKERQEVITKGIEEAIEKNGFDITIDEIARRSISELSEGYPHFLQEFAYFAFEVDEDNNIDQSDVNESLFMENGAFAQLGSKYFNNFYIRQIASEDYRLVLKVMAKHLDNWVTRATIIKESGLKADTVDNATRALTDREIIKKNERVKGEYRLPTKSFAVWIRVQQLAEGKSVLTLE